MTLDHHPAGSSPLDTAQGTLHAYRHACKLTHINSGHPVNSWVGELPVWACLGPSAVVGL